MAGCKITKGLGCGTCDDVSQVGGIKAKNIYVGNSADLVSFTKGIDGTVSAINFAPYGFLYKFCAKKKSGSATQTLAKGDNGIGTWQQAIIGKFEQQSQDAKNVWDELKLAESLFVIIEKTSGQFELYGESVGLELIEAVKSTGTLSGDDNSFNITMGQSDGGEPNLAPDFLVTDYETTKTYLESLTQ